ncbi:MAG: ATP-dependent metallopeptidase FtsH/Yme1/Tma family protein, partial [Gaiellaceae bacterium]
MNRFFRSALFPLIVIVLLVYLASQTLIPDQKAAKKVTYSDLIQRVQKDPESIELVVFNPRKQQITAEPSNEDEPKVKVHYPTPQSQIEFQNLLQRRDVAFDSKGVGSSAWWGLLGTFLPLALLILFWLFIMNQVQGGGSKVMSFGKSRAKRMS